MVWAVGGGSGYRCGFGRSGARRVVEATHDPESATVLCASPAGMLGYVPVSLSLNAQQFSSGGPTLTVYDPDSLESLMPGEAETMAEVV